MHSKQWKLHRAVLCLLVATVVGMVLGGVARAETAALAVQDTPHASPGQPAGQEPEAESTEHEAGHPDPFAIILLASVNTSRTKNICFRPTERPITTLELSLHPDPASVVPQRPQS